MYIKHRQRFRCTECPKPQIYTQTDTVQMCGTLSMCIQTDIDIKSQIDILRQRKRERAPDDKKISFRMSERKKYKIREKRQLR